MNATAFLKGRDSRHVIFEHEHLFLLPDRVEIL